MQTIATNDASVSSGSAGRTVAPVYVFGECLVDRFGDESIPGGAPFNLACHLAGFGLFARLITRIGTDPDGALLRRQMRARGVDDSLVQADPRLATGEVLVREDEGGHRFEILADRAYDRIERTPALVQELVRPGEGAWLYFGTLAQRSVTSRETLAWIREQFPGRRLADLNWREGQVSPALALATLDEAEDLKISLEELDLLLQWSGLRRRAWETRPSPGQQDLAIAALLRGRRVRRLVLTLGADGYCAWSSTGSCEHCGDAASLVSLQDTVGAGDAFTSVVLAGRVLGWPEPATYARAAQFAAAVCGLRGAVPADVRFYDPWRRQWGLQAAPA